MLAEGIEIVQRSRLRQNSGSMEFAETKVVSRRSLKFVRYTLRLEDLTKSFKEARKGFSLHARAQSTHAITKMYASAK